MDKIEKSQVLNCYFERDYFEGDINEVAKRIQNIPEKLKEENEYVKKNPDLFYRFELNLSLDYDNAIDFEIFGFRLETDKEFNERIEHNRKKEIKREKDKQRREERIKISAQKKKEKEFEEYQRLKSKFEK